MEYPRHFPRIIPDVPDGAGKHILVVEDNPLNMKLFSAMIAAQGHRVLQATDGWQALDLVQRRRPELIVMDIELPGLSGLDVARSLKEDDATRDIPILLTTAYAYDEDSEPVRASGCDAFMKKPIAISAFLRLIEICLLRSAQARHCLV